MADDEPKSAIELAMERLQKQDQEQGLEERQVTDEQKAAIAEIRRTYEAKLAECEILHTSKLAGLYDPEERRTVEDGYHRERDRLSARRESKIEEIRSGKA